ncbi:MAG: hypothetical protein ACI30J_06350 [Paludibacteraceae bacterium]
MKSYCIVVTCPHCGKEKEFVQVRGGFVFRRFQWWDMRKASLPSSSSLSEVQHCAHCGRYFLLHDGDYTESEVEQPLSLLGEATDLLSYEQTREAWEQLKNELQHEDLATLALCCLQRYNDCFQRERWEEETKREKSAEDILFAKEVVEVLINNLPTESTKRLMGNSLPAKSPLLCAEFLREAGEFERAMEILKALPYPSDTDEQRLYNMIKENCAQSSTLVGIQQSFIV